MMSHSYVQSLLTTLLMLLFLGANAQIITPCTSSMSNSFTPCLNLAISLHRVCKTSVPLKCKTSGDPLPAPGPVLFGPSAAPAAASTQASKAAAEDAPPPADTLDMSPESPLEFSSTPNANPGIRPVVNPKSDSDLATASLPYVVLIFIGIMVYKF